MIKKRHRFFVYTFFIHYPYEYYFVLIVFIQTSIVYLSIDSFINIGSNAKPFKYRGINFFGFSKHL